MKRALAIFLIASPAWVASGLAGWWLGGGNRQEQSSTPAPPSPTIAVASTTPNAKPRQALGEPDHEAVPHAAKADPHPVAPQLAMNASVAPPKVAPLPAPAPVTVQPPAAEPIASLGSTDVSAPEKVLAPATADSTANAKAGVLIVVSLASQKAFVFKDGELWGSTAVSTGTKGRRTPVGRYTILEKQVHHISRKYDNAPMPYMQRLTWGGVAMHAGHVTGRPASHGCIRLPRSFAKKLYNLTDFGSTTVVVTDKKARSSKEAREAG